jgi:hypothetical protein
LRAGFFSVPAFTVALLSLFVAAMVLGLRVADVNSTSCKVLSVALVIFASEDAPTVIGPLIGQCVMLKNRVFYTWLPVVFVAFLNKHAH